MKSDHFQTLGIRDSFCCKRNFALRRHKFYENFFLVSSVEINYFYNKAFCSELQGQWNA